MTDIFVSYASEDRDRIEPLVKALQDEGWSVWWDRDLVAGPSFDEKIEEALDAAHCVVIAWSKNSIKSRWCRTEANEGLERQVLVPLTIDEVRPPLAFRSSQTASLTDWPREPGELDAVLLGIRQCLRVSAVVSTKPDSQVKSIAVLPFVNMSSDPEQEYFVDGLTEDLIDRLAKHSSLRVIARTSSFYFKNRADDVREIGTRLGVTHLVEGSVRRVGTKIRVTAQLVRTDDGSHEWSEQYDRELGDVFAVQDEITKEVTHQLTNLLIQPATTYQPKPDAYDEYLKGQTWLRRSSFKAAQQARFFFDRAFQADPSYAEACAASARALFMERYYGADRVLEPLELAADYVNKALALDPNLASALVQKARVLAEWDFDIQRSLDLLSEVLDREPDMYEGLSAALRVYEFAGRSHLAELAARNLIRIDPLSDEGNSWLFFLLLQQGRLKEAQEVGDSLVALEPDNRSSQVYANMAILMSRQGRLDEALAFIEEHELQTSMQACFVYAQAGRRDDLEKAAAALESRAGTKVFLTHCYALLGDIGGVERALKEAIAGHDPMLFHLVPKGPYHERVNIDGNQLETIYNGPEVQNILSQINLDQDSIRGLVV